MNKTIRVSLTILMITIATFAVAPLSSKASPITAQSTQSTTKPTTSKPNTGLPPIPAAVPGYFSLGLFNTDTSTIPAGLQLDYRYQYLAGGVNTGNGWATWNPNGGYATNYINDTRARGLTPTFIYYQILQSAPSYDEYSNFQVPATMRNYYDDFKLLMQKCAQAGGTILVDIEPDLTGVMQQHPSNTNNDASRQPVSVASSGQADVQGAANNFRGFYQALAHIRDVYASNVTLGIDVSSWGAGDDIAINRDPAFDWLGHATNTATYINSLGPGYQMLFWNPCDRDAAYYQIVQGSNRWWDDTNTTYPNFNRMAQWMGAIVSQTQKRVMMWQVPNGNRVYRSENNTDGHYQDNRAEYFLNPTSGRAHMSQWANNGFLGMMFGAGVGSQTHYSDVKNDGITNPGAINGNSQTALYADDDGGYLRLQIGNYYSTGTLALPGGGAPNTPTPTAVTTTPSVGGVPRPDHVVVVIEENHAYGDIIGSSQAPYINGLAQQGALFTNSYAIEHPSEPNYLDLFSGDNQGITDDSCPHTFGTANLGSELINAGLGFAGYSEDLPSPGSTACTSGSYARKHNPWVNFNNIPSSDNQPFTSFPSNFATLPTLSVVVPNLDNDMHDGSIQQGDNWLQNNISSYVQWAQSHNSLLILTWDEDDSSGSNLIPTIFVGPMVVAGQYGETIDHYTVLRTMEDMYGLPHAGSSGGASPITDVWTSVGPTATAIATATPAATNTPTRTRTTAPTRTNTNTRTPVNTPTNTSAPNNTATNTPVAVNTATNTPVPNNTATNTPTPTSGNCETVTWVNGANVAATGNSIQKTGGTGSTWDAGAISSRAIQSGNGYVQATVDAVNTYRMFGLSNGDTNQSHTDIDFAAYLAGSTLIVYERGVNKGSFGSLAVGDVIRVSVENGIVKYYRNSTLVYTSSTDPRYPLLLDSSINSAGGRISNAYICGANLGSNATFTPNATSTRTMTPTATNTPVPGCEVVTWTNGVNVTATNNSIQKTGGAPSAWDAGAVSNRAIQSGDGYVQATVDVLNTYRMFGLSNGDTNQTQGDIDYAAYLAGNTLMIYEHGVYKGSFGSLSIGDAIRVSVESGVVKYYRNGGLVYTSTASPTYPLLLDTSINSAGGRVSNAYICGANLGLR